MSTSFLVLVSGSPTQTQAHLSALRFAEAAVRCGHRISQIFFYSDAVQIANQLIVKPVDEAQLTERWRSFSESHGCELQVCIAAATRRGVLSEEEATLNQQQFSNVAAGFSVLGLGQLAAAMSNSAIKLIHFK